MDTLFDKEAGTTTKDLKPIFEAVLFVAKKPVTIKDLQRICPEGVKVKESEIAAIIEELKVEYIQNGRSFRILEIADGYQMRTSPDFAPVIAKYFQLNKTESLTQPALETLAVIAYRQPVTKATIEGVRGVDSSGVVKSLYEKGLVKIAGRLEVPGRPFMYATTERFLEHFGLKNVEDLPHRDELRAAIETQETMDFAAKDSEEEKTGENEEPAPENEKPDEEETGDEEAVEGAEGEDSVD